MGREAHVGFFGKQIVCLVRFGEKLKSCQVATDEHVQEIFYHVEFRAVSPDPTKFMATFLLLGCAAKLISSRGLY